MTILIYKYTMKDSVYLLRANPALTTNIKLVCDSTYNLYLESYSANKELSDNKYKKVLISSDSFISERMAFFYKDLPSNLAFEVKNNIKSDTIQREVDRQYDDIYYSGMRMVEDTRYTEEFQYNTTLKVEPSSLPQWFFIFRQDGSGLENNNDLDTKKLKVIKFFDLSKSTAIGKLFQKNYIDDDVIPVSPFELNLKKFEFSKWNGYDYKSGGTVSKSMFLEDYMRNETTHFEMERFITSQFQKNEVICSNYINISFLFDDTVSGIFEKSTNYDVATSYKFMNEDIYNGDFKIGTDLTFSTFGIPSEFQVTSEKSYRKRWTINRYHGFYLKNLIFTKKISPMIPVNLNTSGISVYKNEFIVTGSQISGPIQQAMPLLGTWDDNKVYYIKIKETYYLLDKNTENILDVNGNITGTIDHYYIISDVTFNPDTEAPLLDLITGFDPVIKIVWDPVTSAPYITYQDNIPFKLDYDSKIKTKDAVFLLIKIYDNYYNVEYTDGDNLTRKCKIVTDWYLSCDGNKFVRKFDSNKAEEIFTQILNKEERVPYFEFYVPQFVQVADFDFARDNTGYANIENDNFQYVNNTRPFLKEFDITDVSSPKDVYTEQSYQIVTQNPLQLFSIFFDEVNIVDTAQYVYPEFTDSTFVLPTASEYAATGDLYILNNQNSISDIWNVNQSQCKWGYLSGIGNASYPYKINNSLSTSLKYNFTPNPFSERADATEFSLDWFYTFGIPCRNDNLVLPGFQPIYLEFLDIYFRTLNIDLYKQYQTLWDINLGHTDFLSYFRFDMEYYKNPNSKLNLFNYFLNFPVVIGETSDDTIHEILYKYYVKRTSEFIKGDGYNGPSVFFKGLKAYVEYVKLNNPNEGINKNIQDKIEFTPADDIAGFEFSIIFNNKETSDITLHGQAGIDVIINKIHKNVLIYIYIWTPYNCKTSLSHTKRDNAYSEKVVSYLRLDTVDAAEIVDSELSIENLRLSILYKILNSYSTEYPGFSDGIHYSMVEEVTQYPLKVLDVSNTVLNLSDCIYDASINGFFITLTIDGFFPIKQGDWIYLKFLSLPYIDINKNYKVKSIINDKITIELRDASNVLGITPFSLNISELSYLTKEISLIPFRLRCIVPEEIKINDKINLVTLNNSAPIRPDNNVTNLKGVMRFYPVPLSPPYTFETTKILINDLLKIKDGTVENVWRNNPLLRGLVKANIDTELTYKAIDDLPSIYRYSGDYEPVINNVNLFNKFKLIEYGQNTKQLAIGFYPTNIINSFLTFYIKLMPSGKYKLIIEAVAHQYNGLLGETDPFKIKDIIYFSFCTLFDTFNDSSFNRNYNFSLYDTYNKIANKYFEIDSILNTYTLTTQQVINLFTNNVLVLENDGVYNPLTDPAPNHLVYVIETSYEFDGYDSLYEQQFDISGDPIYIAKGSANYFKQVEDNISFDRTLKDFGINKSIIIGKYTTETISPLKSSNALYDEKNKFAMDDEHGVTQIDRSIFKSSWDLEYYYKTEKNKFNT